MIRIKADSIINIRIIPTDTSCNMGIDGKFCKVKIGPILSTLEDGRTVNSQEIGIFEDSKGLYCTSDIKKD
jgi:hypothetical protein